MKLNASTPPRKRIAAIPILLALVATTLAQEPQNDFDPLAPISTYKNWTDPARLEILITDPRPSSSIALGRSDFAAGGPLVESLRWSRRSIPERTFGRRFLDLPIVSLFVPQPMVVPPRDAGRYFAWGDKNQPWVAIADQPLPGGPPYAPLLTVNR